MVGVLYLWIVMEDLAIVIPSLGRIIMYRHDVIRSQLQEEFKVDQRDSPLSSQTKPS